MKCAKEKLIIQYFAKKIVFITGLLAILLTPALATQTTPAQGRGPDLQFRRLSVKDGLSHTAVFAISQDRKGFMWFGTLEGLNKYDGAEFMVYKPDPDNSNSLSDSFITAIYEDRVGNLLHSPKTPAIRLKKRWV